MRPGQDASAYGSRTATVLAVTEIVVGVTILYWAFAYGMYDESSLGTVFFLWGAIAALFGLCIPGVVLLVPSRVRWWLQPFPALLAVVTATTVVSAIFAALSKAGHY
jgi:hypothetical protein